MGTLPTPCRQKSDWYAVSPNSFGNLVSKVLHNRDDGLRQGCGARGSKARRNRIRAGGLAPHCPQSGTFGGLDGKLRDPLSQHGSILEGRRGRRAPVGSSVA